MILPFLLATGYGDPHFRSMDGTEFTYNGKGEFWLLRSILTTAEGTNPLSEWEHIRIQVRLEQPSPISSSGMLLSKHVVLSKRNSQMLFMVPT